MPAVVLITDAADGIGYAICERLIEQGARLVLAGRKSQQSLAEAVAQNAEGPADAGPSVSH